MPPQPQHLPPLARTRRGGDRSVVSDGVGREAEGVQEQAHGGVVGLREAHEGARVQRRLGAEADRPTRIKYKPISR